jgi:hypothetical protein
MNGLTTKRGYIVKKVAGILFGLMLIAGTAFAHDLSWDPVTLYTDGSLIGADANGTFYNVEMDGIVTATKITAIKWTLPLVIRKSIHSFRAQCEVGTGEKSAWSPVYTWTAPAFNPLAPGHLNVARLVELPEDYQL